MRRTDRQLAGAHRSQYPTFSADVAVYEVTDVDGRTFWEVITTIHRPSGDVATTLLYEDCEPHEAAADALQYTYLE